MRNALWIGVGVLVVIALVLVGLVGGWVLWGQSVWAGGPYAAPRGGPDACGTRGYQMGPGMMRRGSGWGTQCEGTDYDFGTDAIRPGEPYDVLTIEQAREATVQYVASLGYGNLEVAELMEFERNYYAIVEESDSGIGAMELLIDKWTGAVGPEMGPNMMWNARYGMHGRGGMTGWTRNQTNTVTPEEALQTAQDWLDASRPGVTVEDHADPFYGYYTIHTLKDGEVYGMLSVNGYDGEVYLHTWHGDFIEMTEHEDESHSD